MGFLDFLFPKYCVACRKAGDYICANCFSFISFDVAMICLVCNRGSIDGLTHPGCRGRYAIDGSFCAVAYKGVVKKLIYNFKYKPYLSDLRDVLTDLFYESLIQNELFVQTMEKLNPEKIASQFNGAGNGTMVLVPIPLHVRRLRERGYNHAKILADGLSKKLNLPVLDLLQRTRPTKFQFGLKLKDRKKNLKNAFSILSNSLITQYPNVLLVDDILTSGSTLFEAAKTLKKNGAKKVWGLTLARD